MLTVDSHVKVTWTSLTFPSLQTIEDFILLIGTFVAFIAFILWCCFPIVPKESNPPAQYDTQYTKYKKTDSPYDEKMWESCPSMARAGGCTCLPVFPEGGGRVGEGEGEEVCVSVASTPRC